jgi:hypothetical protein
MDTTTIVIALVLALVIALFLLGPGDAGPSKL